jgi:hypothetical protein
VRTRADRRTPTRAEEHVSERHDTDPVIDPVRPGDPSRYPTRQSSAPGAEPGPATGPVTATGPVAEPAGATAYGATTPTTPDYSPRPIAVRRPDVLGGLLLLLAGAAAGISLVLTWLSGRDDTGLDLFRQGIDDARDGWGTLIDTGFWQPLTVIGAGGLLLIIGLILLLPAKRHRFLGLLALIISGLAAAAVLVPLFQADWDLGTFDIGFWFACAVPVLGLLGALKALLTGRRYRPDPVTT